jgi:uncharacterized OsmC-like protein
LAISRELPVEDLKVMARVHLVRNLPSFFKDMVFEVRLEGKLTDAEIEALAREASRHCFVENTLAKSMSITTEVRFNGQKLLTLNRNPEEELAGSGEGTKPSI